MSRNRFQRYRKSRNGFQRYEKPRLSESQILAWADDFYVRVGRWPIATSGKIIGGLGETWSVIEHALRTGYRGLPGGSSLARLLARHRGRRNLAALPDLTGPQILLWADAYYARTGRWPTVLSGKIAGTGGETWNGIEDALRKGARGLPGRSSLTRFLAQHRGKRNHTALPKLRVRQILTWADDHQRRSGRWPTEDAGLVAGSGGETWTGITLALRRGTRGLAGGSSLAQLLAERRGPIYRQRLPDLTISQILAWADDHQRRTGRWPQVLSGPVAAAPGETWANVDGALARGNRGLPGGSSLARLLARRRGVRNPADLPALSVRQILAWADAFHARQGTWPNWHSGPISGSNRETWSGVHAALWQGLRGLPGGSSLPRLLARHRGVRNRLGQPPLTELHVLAWADAHHRKTGNWPRRSSGPIPGSGGTTWIAVDLAFKRGARGLPGRTSLARFLAENRGVPHPEDRPTLTVAQILTWADAHYRRTGQWPRKASGRVLGASEETWQIVDGALKKGRRGLPGGSSLRRLLAEKRGHRGRMPGT